MKFVSLIIFIVTLMVINGLVFFNGPKIEELVSKNRMNLIYDTLADNPIYDELVKLGQENGFDPSFARRGLYRWPKKDIRESIGFFEPKKSFDVLIFGDSTASWGIILNILNQITKKKIGIFAVEAAIPTPKWASITKEIADYYLKTDGFLILIYSDWVWGHSATQMNEGAAALEQMSRQEFHEFLENTQLPSGMQGARDSFFSSHHYKEYEKFVLNKTDKLFPGFRLPDLKIYSNFIEPKFAPELFEAKNENQPSEAQNFFEIEPNQLMMFVTEPKYYGRDLTPGKAGKNYSELIKVNLEAFSKIDREKVFVVPFCENKDYYQKVRDYYESAFRGKAILADMGVLLDQDTKIPFQRRTHVANLGAAMQTIILGQWLNRYFAERSLKKVNTFK